MGNAVSDKGRIRDPGQWPVIFDRLPLPSLSSDVHGKMSALPESPDEPQAHQKADQGEFQDAITGGTDSMIPGSKKERVWHDPDMPGERKPIKIKTSTRIALAQGFTILAILVVMKAFSDWGMSNDEVTENIIIIAILLIAFGLMQQAISSGE